MPYVSPEGFHVLRRSLLARLGVDDDHVHPAGVDHQEPPVCGEIHPYDRARDLEGQIVINLVV